VSASPGSQILILSGPPGVGKTTVAEILAGRSDRTVHLKADAFFGFIRSGYIEPWKPESNRQNQVVARIVSAAADGYAEAGYFTIVDGIVTPGWSFEPLRDSLRAAGHKVSYAVLRAPLSICKARARDRVDFPFADGGVIEQLWRSFNDLGELERNAIDLGEEAPETAADLLQRRLGEDLLTV
jgi:tRNA uridine 5-carbamoylmethylation protein Kti12